MVLMPRPGGSWWEGAGRRGIEGPGEMGQRDWAGEDEGRVFVDSFKNFAWSARS